MTRAGSRGGAWAKRRPGLRSPEVLLEVADRNPLCLEEPAPLIIFQGYGDSSINHQFSVWAKTEHFLELRNSIPLEIKEAFDENDIEIPFPHRTLYTGAETDSFPMQLDQRSGNQSGAGEASP